MPGQFEIYRDAVGQYRFRLKAANGEIILASEGYKQKNGANHGVQSVRKNALFDERYQRKTAADGTFFFNLIAANHEVIGTSETYETKAGREKGINSVKSHAAQATVNAGA